MSLCIISLGHFTLSMIAIIQVILLSFHTHYEIVVLRSIKQLGQEQMSSK